MMKVIFVIVASFFFKISPAQQALEQVAKYYFRDNPFNQEISNFLQQLMHDPTLVNTSVFKRTDTSLFYFKGDYKFHQPFFFKPVRTTVILAENEIVLNDSLNLIDTVFTYQIAGYTAWGDEGVNDVTREFKRFDRKYIKKFATNDYIDLKSGTEVYGAIRNYFLDLSYLAPLSVAWQKISKNHENVFVITLRFKTSGNVAVLPITTDGP